jgi:DNA/RNA-binding domain of Phe-tRNA-synthetase-like protein
MINIKISDKIKDKSPNTVIGAIEANVVVKEYDDKLWEIIKNKCNEIQSNINQNEILKIKNIETSRMAYKSLGKDPSRYKLSSESLVKRVVKGMELYKVNNVVDINNLISLESFYSVGTYDLSKIGKKISLTVGEKDEKYEGIGRGLINLENLPVFEDEVGKFGSTTSDSNRAMINSETNHILMNIISFNGDEELNTYMDYAIELLENYADATIIDTKIIY